MIRIIATLVLLLASWTGTALAQDSTKKNGAQDRSAQSYTEQVARGLAAKMPDSKIVVIGEFELSIRQPNGRERRLVLRNLYHDYQTDPTTLDAIVDTYHAGFKEPLVATVDRTRIVPVIKDRAWLVDGERTLKARGMTTRFLSEDYNDELVIVYAMDEANRTRYLMADEEIGVARKDLRKLAVRNLDRLLPQVQLKHDGDVGLMTANGDYEASLLLFDEIWRGGKVKVDGDIVVAVPAKDALFITGSNNRAGIARLRKAATELKAQSRYQLTDTLFVYRDGRFTRFDGN